MKRIKCIFKSKGKIVIRTAILNDDFTKLSKSIKNEATGIMEDLIYYDNVWGLYFEGEKTSFELHFKMSKEWDRTAIPLKAITWEGGIDGTITDVQRLKVYVKELNVTGKLKHPHNIITL